MVTITKQENSMYALLSDESKEKVDNFIVALLESQKMSPDEETEKVLEDCRNRKNLVGPFDSVDDLMRSLNA